MHEYSLVQAMFDQMCVACEYGDFQPYAQRGPAGAGFELPLAWRRSGLLFPGPCTTSTACWYVLCCTLPLRPSRTGAGDDLILEQLRELEVR